MNALDALFTSAARVAVLRIFMLDPSRGFYQRQLESATGIPIRGIQRELDRLVEAELLYTHREGNRNYYQANTEHPIFPELRAMVLKTSDEFHRLRGRLAMDPAVRLAFLHPADDEAHIVRGADHQVLVVLTPGASANFDDIAGFSIDTVSSEFFAKRLADRPESLAPFFNQGQDLLGRREDVLWRRIEGAGFNVKKGRGVP